MKMTKVHAVTATALLCGLVLVACGKKEEPQPTRVAPPSLPSASAAQAERACCWDIPVKDGYTIMRVASHAPIPIRAFHECMEGAEKGDGPNLPERPGGCCAQIRPVPFFVPYTQS